MSTDLKPRIRKVVATVLGVPADALSDDSTAESVDGWDSMNHLHIVVALESEFGVSLDPDQAIEMMSIRAIERNLVALNAR